tara:strand:+ start:355 stop:1671 length:1317 start_codon:yes stop_codon:yes gene_type:complete
MQIEQEGSNNMRNLSSMNYASPWEDSPLASRLLGGGSDVEVDPIENQQALAPRTFSPAAELPVFQVPQVAQKAIESIFAVQAEEPKMDSLMLPEQPSEVSEASFVDNTMQRMINGNINAKKEQSSYRWCKDRYMAGCSNHWMPQEVNMDIDVAQWKAGLPEGQVRLVKRVLGFFSTADSLAANNIVLGTARHFSSKEVRRYLKRQAFDEAIHTHAYQYIIESLGIPEAETFNAYNEIQTIRAKDEFLIPFIDTLSDPEFKTGTFENDQKFLRSIIMFGAVMEGMFFYGGFANIFALARQNTLPGSSTQIQLIARDEALHSSFGIDAANLIKHENPQLWTEEFKAEIRGLFRKAVELEIDFIREMIPEPMFGISATSQEDYIKFICNRRCNQIGIEVLYPEITKHPLPWLSEMMDLKKEGNFFEKRVTDYSSAGMLSWN